MSGIYIHIPFCKQACSYCDFYFITKQELIPAFTDALISEIESYKKSNYTDEAVKTIYFGGGTPSLLQPAQFERIFEALNRVFTIDAKEITVEMNPDDVTTGYLKELKALGVNRASMGVQSFDEGLLKFMHRAHNPDEARAALRALSEAGFESFTADLIYGNPGQSTDTLSRDIEELLKFNPPHISAYSLTVEPNTRLGKQVELGRITPAGDEEQAEHFDLVHEKLTAHGMIHYEVSNYAMPGKEALHNSSYWEHQNYVGFGPSAHSFVRTNEGGLRWKNGADMKKYLEDPAGVRTEREILDLFTMAEERLMLGLRTVKGVNREELISFYNYKLSNDQLEWIDKESKDGHIVLNGNYLQLSTSGLKIADHLIVKLLSLH
jgi:oxygen-independent coproporphyrinogen-3 oxidase